MGILTSSWAHAHGSLDPGQYASLALTHVQYHPNDPLAYPLSLITLSPPFLVVVYVVICLIRRDLTIILGFFGQLACEGFNLILKRLFKQGRPTDFLGTGYGMPSSHSQFVGYFMLFWCAHFIRFRPGMSRKKRKQNKPSLIDLIRTLEHSALVAFIIFGSLITAYSRYHLSYHTPLQIIVGLSLGMASGLAWYIVCEVISRKPLFGLERSPRRILLENPLFVALRIRDTWSVWDDGGIEAEYGLWKTQWDRLQREEDLSTIAKKHPKGRTYENDLDSMLLALRLASKCDETSTAFCVGCVITNDETGEMIATGFSREQPGNTHAEEVAINKIRSTSQIPMSKSRILPLSLYTTMEPCSERLSKKNACVQNILKFNQDELPWSIDGETFILRIVRIVQGVREPEDFVQCVGSRILQENGMTVETFQPPSVLHKGKEVIQLKEGWYEREAIRLAKFGHEDQPKLQSEEEQKAWKELGWSIDNKSNSESRKSR
ncbi:hypothetical protein L7F22_009389 [Adiantum nelumboides]|nr:hypothetical protein [Adiantum nelumboides]